MSLYLVALANSAAAPALRSALAEVETGRDLSSAEVLSLGPLTAIACNVLAPEIRPNRRNLLAHMRLLETAQKVAEVLPVRFGQVFNDADDLAEGIAARVSAIQSEIARLSGKSEIAVRVSANRDRTIASLAQNHPELKTLYGTISAKGAAGHYELIELGRKVGQHLKGWRDAAEDHLLDFLRPAADECQVDPPAEDIEILRADFLIPTTGLEAFEAALSEALLELPHTSSEDVVARIVGPVPACRFVKLEFSQGAAPLLGSAA
ncbi:MAG: GvpL/GvpF family gas vesicle protein [Pseudomonadota bacterium]